MDYLAPLPTPLFQSILSFLIKPFRLNQTISAHHSHVIPHSEWLFVQKAWIDRLPWHLVPLYFKNHDQLHRFLDKHSHRRLQNMVLFYSIYCDFCWERLQLVSLQNIHFVTTPVYMNFVKFPNLQSIIIPIQAKDISRLQYPTQLKSLHVIGDGNCHLTLPDSLQYVILRQIHDVVLPSSLNVLELFYSPIPPLHHLQNLFSLVMVECSWETLLPLSLPTSVRQIEIQATPNTDLRILQHICNRQFPCLKNVSRLCLIILHYFDYRFLSKMPFLNRIELLPEAETSIRLQKVQIRVPIFYIGKA